MVTLASKVNEDEAGLSFDQFCKLAKTEKMISNWVEVLADTETPVSVYNKLQERSEDAFLLESVEQGEKLGRYSIIGYKAIEKIVTNNIDCFENLSAELKKYEQKIQECKSVLMIYFEKNLINLKNFELFIFVLMIQILSANLLIIFINLDKFITVNFIKRVFSLLSKQTYSIYLFHFAAIYFIEINNLHLGNQLIFIFYLVFLFVFSSLFYYFLEKVIIENRPNYKNNSTII